MSAFRSTVHLLMALLLGAQGVVMAATALLHPGATVETDGAVPLMEVAASPGHGQPLTAAIAEENSTLVGACCDLNCPDMLSCLLGAQAAPAAAVMVWPQTASLSPVFAVTPLDAPPLLALLRPPITRL